MEAWSFDDYSKIDTLFGGYWIFCQSLRLIDRWWLVKRWACCCWACGKTYRGDIKMLAAGKALKLKDHIFLQNRAYLGKTKEKQALLIFNRAKTK